MHRRKALEIIGAAAGALAVGNAQGAPLMSQPRLPTVFLPHGGGPWPFVDLKLFEKSEVASLAGYLEGLTAAVGRPRALLVISAHWEAAVPTVSTHPRPPMLYDYYGFPPASYTITWPAPRDFTSFAASQTVPAVETMSSTIRTVRPLAALRTSSTTLSTSSPPMPWVGSSRSSNSGSMARVVASSSARLRP